MLGTLGTASKELIYAASLEFCSVELVLSQTVFLIKTWMYFFISALGTNKESENWQKDLGNKIRG